MPHPQGKQWIGNLHRTVDFICKMTVNRNELKVKLPKTEFQIK